MKLAKLTDARFHAALQKLNAQSLPLRVAFKLKSIQLRIDEELKKFEECRQSALNKFGKKDAEGKLILQEDNSVEFEPGQLQAFAHELNDLGQIDIDLPTVKLDDLGDKLELSINELVLLDGIIVE
jgi:hypothetical protein